MNTPHGTLVYQLDTSDDTWRDDLARTMVNDFVTAHGIDPKLFMIGTSLLVYRRADGTFWLHTWQALPDHPLCETCPSCIRQEPVVVPLAAPVPAVAGACFSDLQGANPAVAEPVDDLAAAESAYQAVLEGQSRAVERMSQLVAARRKERDMMEHVAARAGGRQ